MRDDSITQLLAAWNQGDEKALDKLMPLAYQNLKRSAYCVINRRNSEFVTRPTSLVHELYIHFQRQNNLVLNDSSHFYAIATKKFNQILIDKYRKQLAIEKMNNALADIQVIENALISSVLLSTLITNNQLNKLKRINPQAARIAEMLIMNDFNIKEVAISLSLSRRTVDRKWKFAKAWLVKHS